MSVHIEEKRIVEQLANGMMVKLAKNRHKTTMSESRTEKMLMLLKGEVEELEAAIKQNGTSEAVFDQCSDVANFAAMIADNVLHGPRGRR